MIEHNTWTIEQHGWNPDEEPIARQQMVFSNDYLCQSAYIEEHYASQQQADTYIKGVNAPLPNLCAVSVRLHDESLDMAEWQISDFCRTLYRNEPKLTRQFTATDAAGNRLMIHVTRQLSTEHHERFEVDYVIQSINYQGPVSMLPQLGGGEQTHWYPLKNDIDLHYCSIWFQSIDESIQVCCAMDYQLYVNDEPVTTRPIKVDKRRISGFSHTVNVEPGTIVHLTKHVVVVDSRQYPIEQLPQVARQCLTNW